MDPNVTLRRIEDALVDSDWQEACDSARDLRDWLLRGGYPPNLSRSSHREAAKFYRAFIGETE